MTVFQRVARLGLALVLGAFVAGCAAQMEEDIGHCEPGVSDLSNSSAVTPSGC